MTFNSSKDFFTYIEKLLEKGIEIFEPQITKICKLNDILIGETSYIAGDTQKATLATILILDDDSIKLVYKKESWIKLLPSLYQDNKFLEQFLFGFQQTHQGMENTIDSISEQFTPYNTEFISWLGNWVGVEFGDDIDTDSKRKLLSDIVRLYKIRGTKEYFISIVKHLTNVTITIDDLGEYSKIHHNLLNKNPDISLMKIFINEKVSNDEREESKKLSIIKRIFENEKPINVAYEIIYQHTEHEVSERSQEKAFEITSNTDDYYNYENLD